MGNNSVFDAKSKSNFLGSELLDFSQQKVAQGWKVVESDSKSLINKRPDMRMSQIQNA